MDGAEWTEFEAAEPWGRDAGEGDAVGDDVEEEEEDDEEGSGMDHLEYAEVDGESGGYLAVEMTSEEVAVVDEHVERIASGLAEVMLRRMDADYERTVGLPPIPIEQPRTSAAPKRPASPLSTLERILDAMEARIESLEHGLEIHTLRRKDASVAAERAKPLPVSEVMQAMRDMTLQPPAWLLGPPSSWPSSMFGR